MPRDMQLLRDLWNAIEPTSSLGKEYELTANSRGLYLVQEEQRIQRAKEKAYAEVRKLTREGRDIPKALAHFTRGYNTRNRIHK